MARRDQGGVGHPAAATRGACSGNDGKIDRIIDPLVFLWILSRRCSPRAPAFSARRAGARNQLSRIVLNLERRWLESAPWSTVVTVNAELCQKDNQPHGPNPAGYNAAKKLWDESAQRNIKLRDALDLCRQIHKVAPFRSFNGNTVAAVAKLIVGEALQPLPPVQAQIARSTVSHYVVGAIKPRELEDVFGHFGNRWTNPTPPSPSASAR